MFDFAYFKATPSALRPARALLTPTWIGALTLLVLNDHFLKGSGLLPDVLTGKLSDFAGMLVAPALLAALIGARSHRALLACHVAVGAVFAGIQLSLGFADLWAGLMGAIGHPWVITSDPTDLIALPFLALSWKLLVPEMNGELPALAPLQRTATACLSLFGLWSTVATSQENWIDDGNVWYEDVYGQAYINNANDFDISLHIRPLRDDVVLDCAQVAIDPGRLLTEDAFGEAVHWSLPPRTNVAFDIDLSGALCGAVWIGGEGIAPQIVFSNGNAPAQQWFPGQSFDLGWIDSVGMTITFPAEGPSQWSGADNLRFTPKTRTPEQPASCELPSGESRFAWPLATPSRAVRLLSVDPGVDGCFALELQELVGGGGQNVDNYGEPYDFYMCVPAPAMPFVEGDVLRFDDGYDSGSTRELTLTLLDGESLETALDDNGLAQRVASYLIGGSDPSWIGPAINRTLVAVDAVSCPWQIEDEGCAGVERLTNLAVSGGQAYLLPGEAISFSDEPGPGAMVRTAVLGHARQLAVIDQACAAGSLQLHYDIDFAVIVEPLI